MNDVINHPAHYTDGGIEVIDFIEAKGLGYHLGNALKYICYPQSFFIQENLDILNKYRGFLKSLGNNFYCIFEQIQRRNSGMITFFSD